MRRQSRFARGRRLAKDSWSVLRSDRSLALFPIVGSIAAAAALALVCAPGIAVAAVLDTAWAVIPFAAVGLYLATFITISAGVGLATVAAEVMEGREATLRDGLAAARRRRGVIARWALVQATVGLVLRLLQGMADSENGIARLIGTIVVALAGAAWSIATFFVVPLLAFEDVEPRAALRRSLGIVRERWGEGVVGSASIGGVVVLAGFLPGALLVVAGLQAMGGSAAGLVVAALGVVVLLVSAVVANALSSIFRVALYRYATAGHAADAYFAEADLEAAFRPKRRSGARAAVAA